MNSVPHQLGKCYPLVLLTCVLFNVTNFALITECIKVHASQCLLSATNSCQMWRNLFTFFSFFFFFFFFFFAVTSNRFGSLCFRFLLILPEGFKVRVDPSSPVLCSRLPVMILRVNSEFPDLGLVPILHLGMVRLLLEWPPNVTSGMTDGGKIRTQNSIFTTNRLFENCPIKLRSMRTKLHSLTFKY